MEYIVNDKVRFVYSKKSSSYMMEIIDHFEKNYQSLSDFFDKDGLNRPLVITFWDDKKAYREELVNLLGYDAPELDFSAGMATSGIDIPISRVDCLSLEAVQTIGFYESDNVESLKKRVVHETTHVFHDEFTNYNYHFLPTWIPEGVATYLSQQYENSSLTVPLEEVKKDDKWVDYQNYRYVFDKVIENCSKDEVLNLLKGIDIDKTFQMIEQNNSNKKK